MENEVNSSYPEEPCRWCGGTELDIWQRVGGEWQCGCYKCYAMGPLHKSQRKAIAAWNARAGGEGEPVGYVAVCPNGDLYDHEVYDSGNEYEVTEDETDVEIKPIFFHPSPAPAIDAREVERLANALMYIPVHDSDGRYAARAALLAYVSKGVDVGELVEAAQHLLGAWDNNYSGEGVCRDYYLSLEAALAAFRGEKQ